jgi:hypothetical protein
MLSKLSAQRMCLLLLAAGMVVSLGGCQTGSGNAPVVEASGSGAPMLDSTPPMDPIPTGLPLATNSRFPDVPLPLGVKEDMDRTYVFESGGFRVGRMVFTTRDSVTDVAQFYIRECPIAGWVMTSTVQAEGVQLQFSKGGERLDVSVSAPGVGRANVLILHLTPSAGPAM